MSLSLASFAYVGVEVLAATVIEVKWPKETGTNTGTERSKQSNKVLLVGKTIKHSSVWISVVAAVAYVVTGTLATIDIEPYDCDLPRLSWTKSTKCKVPANETEPSNDPVSVFVVIAQESQLKHVINAIILFAAVTCASTNLYVASRSLFGLTSRLDGGLEQEPESFTLVRFLGYFRTAKARQVPVRALWISAFAYFGRTNDRRVPVRAVWLSAIAFCWVPFLGLAGGQSVDKVSSSLKQTCSK